MVTTYSGLSFDNAIFSYFFIDSQLPNVWNVFCRCGRRIFSEQTEGHLFDYGWSTYPPPETAGLMIRAY